MLLCILSSPVGANTSSHDELTTIFNNSSTISSEKPHVASGKEKINLFPNQFMFNN
jgi:hypothetical protein